MELVGCGSRRGLAEGAGEPRRRVWIRGEEERGGGHGNGMGLGLGRPLLAVWQASARRAAPLLVSYQARQALHPLALGRTSASATDDAAVASHRLPSPAPAYDSHSPPTSCIPGAARTRPPRQQRHPCPFRSCACSCREQGTTSRGGHHANGMFRLPRQIPDSESPFANGALLLPVPRVGIGLRVEEGRPATTINLIVGRRFLIDLLRYPPVIIRRPHPFKQSSS